MKLKNDWLWDRKITIKKARQILKNPLNEHFISLAGALLSRKNTPKEVFKYYLKPLDFLNNWNRIKRRMRQDKWNDPRIEFWQAVYEVIKQRYQIEGRPIKKEGPSMARPESEFYKAVADKIKQARKQKGLSQAVLAKKLGVSQQGISRIEKGRENISLGTLKKILDAMGVQLYFEIHPK